MTDKLHYLQLDRLINCWLREFRSDLMPELIDRKSVTIETLKGNILVTANRLSPSGFHGFEPPVLQRLGKADREIEQVSELADLLLSTQTAVPEARRENIRVRITQSAAASAMHSKFSRQIGQNASACDLEQSLWFGHPFHPLAKSVSGFDENDLRLYAPERGSRFQLCWLLVSPAYTEEWSTATVPRNKADQRLIAVSGFTNTELAGRTLFPCHPWQYKRLLSDPTIQAAITAGYIIAAGPRGDMAVPTSSVRTVWFLEKELFVKLPIEARLTNFSRVNTLEQIVRTIEGAKALAAVKHAVEEAGFSIFDEPMGRIVASTENPGTGIEQAERTGYLLRLADHEEKSSPLVVAGLVERHPQSGRINLASVCQNALSNGDKANEWIEAYTARIILPLLLFFQKTGVALEAHTQNSLLSLEGGMPHRLYVRDLEGVAIDREKFTSKFGASAGRLDDAVFYDHETAWKRLLYYVIVNHFAHVVSAVAEAVDIDEARLWARAHRVLAAYHDAGAVARLLESETLPAKANLLSCLHERGETPAYVAIANPLYARRAQAPMSDVSNQIEEALS